MKNTSQYWCVHNKSPLACTGFEQRPLRCVYFVPLKGMIDKIILPPNHNERPSEIL